MSKIGIVDDTGSTIPAELAEEYGIEVVPVITVCDDKPYRDWIDLKTPAELFKLIDKADKFPTTSAPPPTDYLEVFHRLSQKVDGILCVTISSKMSMCFESATLAKEMAQQELPDVKIEVFDSRMVVGAAGFIALAAARAGAAGQDISQVIEVAKEVQSKINFICIMDTLTYLAKSGRIGRASALMGNMLSIKPIIEVPPSTGLVEPVARIRTKPKAVDRLLEMAKQRVGQNPVHVIVKHTIVPKEAERLKEKVSAQFNCVELHVCEFNPTATLITGPRNLGLSFYSDGA